MYIKTYKDACPICIGEVKGNSRAGYLCNKCNIIFKYKQLHENKELELIHSDLKRINNNKT